MRVVQSTDLMRQARLAVVMHVVSARDFWEEPPAVERVRARKRRERECM